MDSVNHYRLLVVDDNLAIHDDFRKLLLTSNKGNEDLAYMAAFFGLRAEEEVEHSNSYEIDFASQGEDAIQLVQEAIANSQSYALAFVDIRMPPGLDGIETIQKLWQLDPCLQVVICTAYSDYSLVEISHRLVKTDQLLILKKPFESIEIKQLAAALTKKWHLTQMVRAQIDEVQEQVNLKTCELQRSYSILRSTLEATNDGILVVNNERIVVDYNQRFLELFKIPVELAQLKDARKLSNYVLNQLEDPQKFIEKINALYSHPESESYDVLFFNDGRVFERYSKPQYLEDDIIGRVWSFRDVTQRIQLEEKLTYQATHDALTGLPNRELLFEQLHMAIAHSKRLNKKFAVIFIDLDHFKLVNDSLGHVVGDELLVVAAKRIQGTLRQSDFVCRMGGDEFVAVIEHLDYEEAIIEVVQKILTALSQPFHTQSRDLNITSCVGISIYPRDGEVSEVLFRNADIAMYRAKENGRNNFQFYNSSMNLQLEHRIELEHDLRSAIQQQQFILHYQPLVDLNTNMITGMEALIRWEHPRKGLLLPSDFISVAEDTSLIVSIGEWVLETACRQNKEWHDLGLPPLNIAVNVSPVQIKRREFYSTIEKIIEKTQLNPRYLSLEITENLVMEDNDEIKKTLQKLRKLGVGIVIDDFGMGYSNLNLVHRFPVDKLKIDRAFIRDIKKDSNDRAIVLAIISMAKSFKIGVLAEGVEEKFQQEFLQENKCDEMQGFYFSGPLPVEMLTNLLLDKFKKNNNNSRE